MVGVPNGSARLGFGCVGLGSASSKASVRSQVRLVEQAIEQGVVTFDTADAYGNGISECIVGRAARGRRSSVEIATKAGYRFTERSMTSYRVLRAAYPLLSRVRAARSGASSVPERSSGGRSEADHDFSPEHLTRAVDASLRRLDTDYIDLFQLHGPSTVVEDVGEAIERLKAGGKIRRFGIGAESVEAAMVWVEAGGIDVVQVPFGVLDPEASDLLFGSAVERGIEVWVRGVLGGGLMAAAASGAEVTGDHEKFALIAELDALAHRIGISLPRLAIEYVRSYPVIARILVGVRSREHLDHNVAIMNGPSLDRGVIDEVERALAQWESP